MWQAKEKRKIRAGNGGDPGMMLDRKKNDRLHKDRAQRNP